MKRRSTVSQRIASRRHQKEPLLFRGVYRITMFAMIVGVGLLGYGIYEKQGFENMEDFLYVGTWFPFEKWFSLEDETVASHVKYSKLKENIYVTGGNEAVAIGDGVVKEVKQKDGKYEVTIKQDNGVLVQYGNLQSVAVKKKERIVKDTTIASFENHIILRFMKDQKEITYDEAMKL